MADYEKDFMVRQTKAMAEGLVKFLGKEKVDEVMKQDMKQDMKEDKHKKELDKTIKNTEDYLDQ